MINKFLWMGSLLLSLAACRGTETASPSASARASTTSMPPVSVNTVVATRQDVPMQLQANATVQALSSVELHSQLVSTIHKVHVNEGQFVKAGQILFSLDHDLESANLAKAKAQLLRDQTLLLDLERQLKRGLELVAQNFVSRGNAETLDSQVQAQRALVQSNQVAVQAAQINVDLAVIRSPMDGRVGEIRVFPGSLVQLSTPLLTVTQMNPIALSFTLPEDGLTALLVAQKAGSIPVKARSGAAQGHLSFIDSAVDNQNGVIRVKAQFDNRDQQWWPGQYTDVQLTIKTLKDVVVVPQAAVMITPRGRFVYTVAADNTATQLPVTILHSFGTQSVVSGLQGGEKIILEGKQNLRPGGKVVENKGPDIKQKVGA
jgi:membrane fusion protein, multidrug efflux system